MTQKLVRLLSILQALFIQSCTAVTCYGYGGGAFTGNVICPGSNACCGSTATCESNRLCHNMGDNNSTFVRGPCAIQPYDPNTCADICLYDEVNGFLPRVTPCADGSLCCNNDPQCCSTGRGVFLDSTGDVVSSVLSSSSTSSISSSSSSTSASFTSSSSITGSASVVPSPSGQNSPTTASPTMSPLPLSSDISPGLSTGTKIGLGVGIPLGVLVLGILVITIWFQGRRLKIAEAAANRGMNPMHEPPQINFNTQRLGMQQQHPVPMQEMDSYKSPILKENDRGPVELPAR